MNNVKEELYVWWNTIGKLAQKPSEELYIKRGKPCGHIKRDVFRSLIKQFRKEHELAPFNKEVTKVAVKSTHEDINNKENLVKKLIAGVTVDTLLKTYNIDYKTVISVIVSLKEDGYNVYTMGDVYKIEKKVITTENIYKHDWDGERIIRFGSVADTHLCSKFQQLTFLHHAYDIFEKEGINKVYIPGDISDGYYKKRAGHEYELIDGCLGVDNQANYIIKNFPKRKGIDSDFILGNHDATHIMNGGANIGKMISRERKDMNYLGMANAIIDLTPKCKLELNHPLDGSAYALSYSLQKLIDAMSGGEKPNILLNGHHHKAFYLVYRNIHAIEAGTICAQTPFMKGKKLAAHIGAWIIEAHVNEEGTITRFKPEFLPCYKAVLNDY